MSSADACYPSSHSTREKETPTRKNESQKPKRNAFLWEEENKLYVVIVKSRRDGVNVVSSCHRLLSDNCEKREKESDNEWCDMPYQVLILIFIKYNNYLWNNWSNGRQPNMILDDEIIWWAQTQCSHSLSDRLPVKLKRKWFLIIRCNLLLLPPMWLIYECSIFLSWE